MNWLQIAATVVCAVGSGLFYYLMELSPRSPKKIPVQGEGEFRMPDVHFHNTPDALYAIFEQAGEEGRPRMRRYWAFDFGFILCFLGVMLAIGWNVVGKANVLYPWMSAVAIARAAVDIVEDGLFLILLRGWPSRKTGLAKAAGIATSAKFTLLYIWVGMLFVKLFASAFHIVI